MGYLCANFSLPRPLCSRLRPDVCDRRQTDVRQHHRFMSPPYGKNKLSTDSWIHERTNFVYCMLYMTPTDIIFTYGIPFCFKTTLIIYIDIIYLMTLCYDVWLLLEYFDKPLRNVSVYKYSNDLLTYLLTVTIPSYSGPCPKPPERAVCSSCNYWGLIAGLILQAATCGYVRSWSGLSAANLHAAVTH